MARSVTAGLPGSVAELVARELTLSGVAADLAASDPDRAERIAHSITHQNAKALALSAVAKALAATSP